MADLTEEARTKLDGIVSQMHANNEPDENIQTVVNDFKQRNSGFLGPKIEPSGSTLKDLFLSPVKGLQDIQSGASDVMKSGSRMKGAHELISGAARTAAPFALPAAAVGAPVATAIGLAGAGIGSGIGSKIAEMSGGGEDAQNLAGDIGGIAGGVGGAKLGDIPSVGSVVKGAVKGAYTEAMSPAKMWKFDRVPQFLHDAFYGGAVGSVSHLPYGGEIGTGVGASISPIRGLIQGGKAGLRDYRDSQIPKVRRVVPPVVPSSPAEFSGTPGALPSGRVPGNVKPVSPATVDVGKTVEDLAKPVSEPPVQTPSAFQSVPQEPEMSDAALASSSSARDAVAQKLSKSFHANHITEDQINAMSAPEQEHFWKTWGRTHQEGYNPSMLTRERTLRQLNILENSPKPARYGSLGKPPGAPQE
jgi:hypothetical protein